MLWLWAKAFVLTVSTEIPVALVAVRDRPAARVAGVTFLCSAVTHPVLWAVWLFGLNRWFPYEAYVLLGEIAVVLVEAAILRAGLRLDAVHALTVSAAMNLVSWGMGELLRPWLFASGG